MTRPWAIPQACGYWVPIVDDWVNTLRDTSDQWFGNWRPPLIGSVLRAKTPRNTSSGAVPHASATPMSR
jgi:hypothetical protein